MFPTREEALKLIRDGLLFNPGPWGKHCLTAAHCAEKIASACGDMDVEKAYILGLLHDIGRKFGVRHLGHVYDGYVYMKSLGYDEVAKICLTHSFNNHTIDEYIGKFDVTDEELIIIKTELAKTIYDEYDRLIQLCDCLAGAEGVLDIENRMNDVKKRYGFYPQDKWNSNMNLKQYFEGKMNKDIYDVEEGKVVHSEVVDTNGSGHGALAGVLNALNADVLICGGIGGGAQTALAAAGIKLFGGVSGDADKAVEAFINETLDYNPDVKCSHHEHNHGEGHTCGEHGCGSHSCH